MIKTAKEAYQLTDIITKEKRNENAEKEFILLMTFIEERAKIGFCAVGLDYWISDVLENKLVAAGFKVEQLIMNFDARNQPKVTISWWNVPNIKN